MRITLVAMPWHACDIPSLAISILHSRIQLTRPSDDVADYYGNLRWAEFLVSASEGVLTPQVYAGIAEDGFEHGLGDWVFSAALYDDPEFGYDELRDYAAERGVDIEAAVACRAYAAEFIEAAAEEILAGDPEVIGFTSTFMQNVATLAVARRIKRLRPECVLILGGANCDGAMGHALHRNHRFLDYVVRGEGELVLPQLLDHVERGKAPEDLPGVCWWDGDRSVCNPAPTRIVPPAAIPSPLFDDWERALEDSPVRGHVQPKLVLEGARGCWWGEKHQCTFCGLNGSFIQFRSKAPDVLWEELSTLVTKHRLLDVVMVDNIIDMNYLPGLLPLLRDQDWDLRIHYEVKSNLRPDQVEQLAAAGVAHIQPGIESLNSRVLRIMDKGVDGCQNVRILREAENNDVTVSWNYLYGFPGETDDDYGPVIEQLPALVHLQPPGAASRISLERFSPYFEDPGLGFPARVPARFYGYTYDLPVAELHDLAYMFDCADAGIEGEVVDRLHASIAGWAGGYPASSLVQREYGDGGLLIEDRRAGWPAADHLLTGREAQAYRLLERGRTTEYLAKALGHAGLDGFLGRLLDRGLIFRDDGRHVALATRNVPIRGALL
ncbi:RiPP maturation radical SAM protein 1 [Pseudonocardiaceae bacterium YIM PH 21723]|nr:RiPP maturation radical SAM protein 1 [Pseudonocardiaceae bacterium YIM PH 21723]